MSYSTEVATLLAKQVSKFVTLNRHQLVGQLANLDFWLEEIRHGLSVLDGYEGRFQRMKVAQTSYVAEHQTIAYDQASRNWSDPVATLQRTPKGEFQDARRALCDATYRFLVRCHNEKLIDEYTLRKHCGELNIGIEASDLKRD
jgi:hypothetical protein